MRVGSGTPPSDDRRRTNPKEASVADSDIFENIDELVSEERDLRDRSVAKMGRPRTRRPGCGRWRSSSTSAGTCCADGGRSASTARIPRRRRSAPPTRWRGTRADGTRGAPGATGPVFHVKHRVAASALRRVSLKSFHLPAVALGRAARAPVPYGDLDRHLAGRRGRTVVDEALHGHRRADPLLHDLRDDDHPGPAPRAGAGPRRRRVRPVRAWPDRRRPSRVLPGRRRPPGHGSSSAGPTRSTRRPGRFPPPVARHRKPCGRL